MADGNKTKTGNQLSNEEADALRAKGRALVQSLPANDDEGEEAFLDQLEEERRRMAHIPEK